MLTDKEIYNNVLSRLDKSMTEYESLADYETMEDGTVIQQTESLEVPQGLRGACIGAMNTYFGDDANRRRVLANLFASEEEEEMSTHALTYAQWYALYMWIVPWKDEDDDKWKVTGTFPPEAVAVMTVAQVVSHSRDVVKDPLFGDDGQPSEITRFLLDKGGKITEVADEVVKTSLLDGTNFGKMMKGDE